MARVVDLRYGLVEDGRPIGQRAGESYRLRIIVEYEAGKERRWPKMEWYWAEKREKRGQATATYYFERAVVNIKDDVEAAVLKTLTGKEAEGGKVWLTAGDLNALRRFKALKEAIDR